jgi:hypothetical protein
MKPLSEDERRASFQPINSSAHGQSRSFQRFVDIGEVE